MKYPHWQYFLVLDRDIETVSRYVEISQDNYDTYSIQFVRLLLSACSEIDVVAKILSKQVDTHFKPSGNFPGIFDYQRTITKRFPKFHTTNILIPKYGITLTPWHKWSLANTPPIWWSCHNKVKHQRDTHYKQANLKNTINAVAGLFVMVLYLYASSHPNGLSYDAVSHPRVFDVPDNYLAGSMWKDTLFYQTPDQIP